MKLIFTFFTLSFFSLCQAQERQWSSIPFTNDITAIHKKNDTLWVVATGGIVEMNESGKIYNIHCKNDSLNSIPYYLPDRVYCMTIDKQNRKWAGTDKGLFRYDGIRWHQVLVNNFSATIPVKALATDSTGNLWVGTNSGVYTYDGTSVWTNYPMSVYYATGVIFIYISADNNVYVSNGNDVKKKLANSSSFTTAYSYDASSMLVDRNGIEWFAPLNDSYLIKNTSPQTIHYFIPYPANTASKLKWLSEDEDGNIWIGASYYGLTKYNGTSFTNYPIKPLSTNLTFDNSASALLPVANGEIWVGTPNGLSLFDQSTYRSFSTGLTSPVVYAIAVEQNGMKWFGTDNGLCSFDGNNWKKYDKSSGLSGNKVNDIAIDAQGNKWIGTDGGVSKFDGYTWTNYNKISGLPENFVSAVYIDSDNNKWFGAYQVTKFDGSTFTIYNNTKQGLADNLVTAITKGANGQLWVNTLRNGLFTNTSGNTWLNVGGDGYDVKLSPDGIIWACGIAALSRYSGNYADFSYTTSNSNIISRYTQCVAFDRMDGIVWVGTDEGVSEFDGTSFTNYTQSTSPLRDGEILDIAVDSENTKWIGTELGISSIGTTSIFVNNDVPSSEIEVPANNSVYPLGSTISILSNARDDDGSVAKVEFFQNGIKIGEVFSEPYEFAWTNAASGMYNITTRSTDNKGAQSEFSVPITVTVSASTSIEEEQKNAYLVYPNPASESVYINYPAQASLEVYDLGGVLILEKQLSTNKEKVDMTHLKAGVYIFKLIIDQEVVHHKVIKK